MKRTMRGEKGNVLILVLILFVVGALVLTPLLGLMSAGLLAGQVYEKKTDELYAADAGVEDAIWKIKNDPPDSYPYGYPEPLIVNGKTVDVVINITDIDPTPCEEELVYQILSTATSEDGSSTTVDAHLSVSYLDLSALLDNAIISQDTITIQPGNEINGDVWLPDKDDPDKFINKGAINGTVKDEDDMSITWPTAEQLSTYYLEDVEGAPDPGSSYDINGQTQTEGPWYRHGSLEIDNTVNSTAILVLQDTVYVTGDLEFKQPGETKDYTINLNGNTIFVEGSITCASHWISFSGSGCIIAVEDIDFQPTIVSEEDDFIFVFSITGLVNFQPSGDFTGCVAGNTHVQLQPGCTINWISPEGKGLDVPWGVGDIDELPPVTGVSIRSWQIK